MKINLYTKLLFAIVTCFSAFCSKGQVNITNGPTAICEGSTVLLNTTVSGRVPSYITYAQNNRYSSVINLGFSFTFYGVAYTQCVISSNGVINFNTANAGLAADNVVDQALPGEPSLHNSIMLPYMALDVLAGGTVDIATVGVAPNRRFVVTFCSVPLQGCIAQRASFQAVLYETTNNIDIHVVKNPASLCPATNSGRSIEGVQNATGTSATSAPGHNFPNAWWAFHVSHRYTPNGPGNYTVASVPYTHIPDQTATITWHAGGFQIGTGPSYNYTYFTTQFVTAQIANCPDTSKDTITVIVNQIYHILDSIGVNPSQCEAADGEIHLPAFFPGDPYDVYYTDQLGNPQMITVTANVAGEVVIDGLVEGTYTNIYVRSHDPAQCQSETVQSMVLVDVSVVIGGLDKTDPACHENNGTVILKGLVPGVTYTVEYTLNSVVTSIVLLADANGDVTIPTLEEGTYSNITAATIDCNSNVVGPITLTDVSPVIATITSTPPSLCRAKDATITLTGLVPDGDFLVRYVLDGFSYTANIIATPTGDVVITGIPGGTYSDITVQIFDCESDAVGPITIQNPPVTADFSFILEPGCTEDVVRFTDLSTGSAEPFQYTWVFGDGNTGNTQSPVHTYEDQATYPVVLMITDSVCKDTVSHDVIINHPLTANFTVDQALVCQGATVAFTDISTATLPATYYWDFANGETNSSGGAAVTSLYANAGTYNAMLIISDFIGCTDTAYKLIQVDSLTEINADLTQNPICAGGEAWINGAYADTGSTGAMWDFGDGIVITTFGHNVDHSYERPGVYTLKLTATGRVCPDVEKIFQLTVQPQPIINLGPDTAVCPTSAPITLHDLGNANNPAATWIWKKDNELQEEKIFHLTITDPATYVSIVTIGACSSADTIEVKNDCLIQIPNAFTPDGDNISDYFMPRQWLSSGVVKFKMQLFNRWGQEVFSTTNPDGRGWDGKFNGEDQPQGVYIYLIEATFKNGVSEKKQGNVTLLR
jgi:gliding motility-associated-like protein